MENRIKKATVVSLSSGILGESFMKHELEIGVKRLNEAGVEVRFSKHALSGLEYIKNHPEKRAEDLLTALESDTDMIFCAIGGDDTYRLLPYLFGNGELEKAVKNGGKNKIFLGFSDTTMNHLMLHKAGMKTFYGQSFLSDVCEISNDMLPYTKRYFLELIKTRSISKITPSDLWYDSRTDFSPSCVGTDMPSHKNGGFELLQGKARFCGEILGGCIDTIYDVFDNTRYADSPEICEKYGVFPSLDDWRGRILLLETSEEKPTPEKYEKMLYKLKNAGVFGVVNGVLVGKPDGETYFDEYKAILREVIADETLPVVSNVNIGHATPRCIIPFGVNATVDAEKQIITFD